MVVRKHRKTFDLDGIEVSLDDIEGLGTFVELEVRDMDMEEGRGLLRDAMARLGLEGSERRSYLELLLEKKEPRA